MQREIEELKRHARILQLSLEGFVEAAEALAKAVQGQTSVHAIDTALGSTGLPKEAHKAGHMLSASEVAEILGVREQTLAKWRASKLDGPDFVKVGGRVRYRWEDLQRYIESRTNSTWGSNQQ